MKRNEALRIVTFVAVFLLLCGPAVAAAQPAVLAPSGTEWLPRGNAAKLSLNALAMASATDGWAVGDGGFSYHWNGNAWNPMATGVVFNLNWVDTVPGGAPAEAWACGENSTTILHFSGSAWQPVTVAAPGQLDAVWMNSTTDGWMVGAAGGALHYTGGTTWISVTTGITTQLHDVESNPTNATDTWAVGAGGTILRWNGATWAAAGPAPAVTVALYNVAVLGTNDVWVVGDPFGGQSTILHWNGATWTPVASPVNTRLWDVWFAAANDGWATGDGGTILHWDGATWTQWVQRVAVPAAPLYAVEMINATDGWIVGNVTTTPTGPMATILHFTPTYETALPVIFKS